MSPTRERPGTVTTVVVLTYLAGFLDIVAGVVIWALAGSGSLQEAVGTSQGTLTAVAITNIVIGLVVIGVGVMLAGGSPFARILVTILMTIRIVAAIAGLALLGLSGAAESIMALAIAVVVIALLWNQRANEYFNAPKS